MFIIVAYPDWTVLAKPTFVDNPVESKSIPSIKISSPTSNWGWTNPRIGVTRVQVATSLIPSPIIVEIPTPFELLTNTSLCVSDANPNNGAKISISAIAPFGAFAKSESLSTISLVVSLIRMTSGSLRYLLPWEIILKSLIVSKLSKFITGGTNVCGLRVLSEG